MPWAKQHDKCLKCGTTEFRHSGRGLCMRCYNFDSELRRKAHIHPKTFRRRMAPISFDDLQRGYFDESMSTTDLARRYNCTRQYIHKLLRQHGIVRRNLSGREPSCSTKVNSRSAEPMKMVTKNKLSCEKSTSTKTFSKPGLPRWRTYWVSFIQMGI